MTPRFAAALVGLILLAGCGSDATEADAYLDPVVVEVAYGDGTVTPTGGRTEVAVGQEVVLRVDNPGDTTDELHVHSDPEHTFAVEPGTSEDFSFSVERPGQVAVESHDLGVTITQLVVR